VASTTTDIRKLRPSLLDEDRLKYIGLTSQIAYRYLSLDEDVISSIIRTSLVSGI
jgi:hypothetical protein